MEMRNEQVKAAEEAFENWQAEASRDELQRRQQHFADALAYVRDQEAKGNAFVGLIRAPVHPHGNRAARRAEGEGWEGMMTCHIERIAAVLAVACNSGSWLTHYTEGQRAVWRRRVVAILSGKTPRQENSRVWDPGKDST